jgi:lipoprotein-releasing system permease protein
LSIDKSLPFEWRVGLRYTRAGRRNSRNRFISFISLISMAGIALGVAALIIIMSIMNGFQKDVLDRMLSVMVHIEISGSQGGLQHWQQVAEQTSRHSEVRGVAPYVVSQAMLMHGGAMRGVVVRGILPEQEPKVSDLAAQTKLGRLGDLETGSFNIALGADLARSLGVRTGDKVTLIAPQGQVTPAGIIPRMRQFNVAATFESGHYQYDTTLAFIHLEDGQRMFRSDGPSGVRVKIEDLHRAPQVAAELSAMIDSVKNGDAVVKDWSQQNRTWFAAVQVEKKMMFIILAMVIAVAAFNLVSTLIMTVTEKQADIAILRTLGASPFSIMKIFMIQGGLVGLLGTAIGLLGGVLVALNISVIVPFFERLFGFQILSSELFVNSTLPSDMHWPDVLVVSAIAVVLAFVATLYPSRRASLINPAEALRYE